MPGAGYSRIWPVTDLHLMLKSKIHAIEPLKVSNVGRSSSGCQHGLLSPFTADVQVMGTSCLWRTLTALLVTQTTAQKTEVSREAVEVTGKEYIRHCLMIYFEQKGASYCF